MDLTTFNHKKDAGLELAISSEDLRAKAFCKILEKHSTAGFEEVPQIVAPRESVKTNRMIQYDQHWSVKFWLWVAGPLACLLDCGYWQFKVVFELMGEGETSFSPETIVQDIGKPGHKYQSEVNIAPGSLRPGVYRVICCLQYYFKDGRPGPIAGFEDKGLVKIFEDKRTFATPPPSNGLVSVAGENG